MDGEFPSNSHKQKAKDEKPEPKKVEQVTSGTVVRRQKTLDKRIYEHLKTALQFVMIDVILPMTKDMVADAVSQGAERMIFGEARSTSRRTGGRPSGSNGYVSYNRYSPNTPRDSHRDEPRNQISRRARSTHDFGEIILATRVEAEEVIDRLFDLVSRYEMATVSDLYDLCGISGNFTDEKYGWTDIRGADFHRVRNGYLLDLPKPEVLN